ncbi:MAG: hypothetical protein ACK55I_22290, partial [bacterium]
QQGEVLVVGQRHRHREQQQRHHLRLPGLPRRGQGEADRHGGQGQQRDDVAEVLQHPAVVEVDVERRQHEHRHAQPEQGERPRQPLPGGEVVEVFVVLAPHQRQP